jgi:predicted naringenin-chalcone synthase
MPSPTLLLSLGTARPPYVLPQTDAPRLMRQVMPGLDSAGAALLGRICAASGIRRRHTVLADVQRDFADWEFFRPDRVPTTADRMRVYRREAPALAAAAAARALDGLPEIRRRVSHLIVASCTGFFAPGPDVELIRRLGLRPDVRRTLVGFQGCHAAFNALAVADSVCRADPDAVALVVCVELCTLHFQQAATPDTLVANCLFADGAAAAVLAGRPIAGRPPLLELAGSASRVLDDTDAQMSWLITDAGFRMTLSTEVPASLSAAVPGLVGGLTARAGASPADPGFWAIHPGGPKIVSALADTLSLTSEQTAPSREVLADCGNMSSATVLFILQRCLETAPAPGTLGAALAFGPGLAAEALLLRVPTTG